ncbi:MAG: hypothetical protein ACTSW7_01175 [Candidatus Thorarchaeota archaeon]|nr:hypothetical protein [Thermoplasmatales archaeon]
MGNIISILKELVGILRDGGPYAGWALFIILWYFERRENKIFRKEGINLAIAQVENNVKTEMTLQSLKEALSGVKYSLGDITAILNKIQTMKESLLQLSSKPDLKLLEDKTKADDKEE